MRHALLLLSLFLSLSLVAPAAVPEGSQDTRTERAPGKGDTVIVTGCLQGPTLQTDPDPASTGALLPAGLTYRLEGKKDVLGELVRKHDGQRVEITGILKTNVDAGGIRRGRRFGRTRITVGVRSGSEDQATKPVPEDRGPVLEVKAFESEGVNCRR